MRGGIWHKSSEIKAAFNPLNLRLNRLMVLGSVWQKLVGKRAKFWTLDAVSKDTIYVKVNVAAARLELAGVTQSLIKELNKHFDKPWIKKIEII